MDDKTITANASVNARVINVLIEVLTKSGIVSRKNISDAICAQVSQTDCEIEKVMLAAYADGVRENPSQ